MVKSSRLSGSTRARKLVPHLGRAKRRSRKAALLTDPLSFADVYEHTQDTGRRARVNVDTRLGKEEAAEFGVHGSDEEDEDEDGMGGAARARLIGEEGVASEDDEEIDSDEAFEEEDEERFAGFQFTSDKKASKAKLRKPAASVSLRTVRFADVNLNEDEDVVGDPTAVAATGFSEDDGERDESDEEEDEDEEEGMVDLVDILDGKAQPYFADDSDEGAEPGNAASPKAKKQAPRPPPPPGLIFGEAPASDEDDVMASADETGSGSEANEGTSDASEESEGDEADAVDDAHTISASDDDATIGGGALDGLSAFISTLDVSAKRKAESDVPPAGAPAERPRKRRFVQDQTEVGTENEFAARMSTGTHKLNLEDLLAPLSAQSSSNLTALKKSTKALASTKAGALSAPLPTRTQERLDREAAYEQTKEEVNKWSATMKHIKEAEHLSFPLQAEKSGRTSNLELSAKFIPTTELESAVDRLLKAARMREEDLQQTEELKMNHLTPEEVQARRAELRRMRELTFRADAKAKRIAKIKSKTFRKIRNKQKAKISAALGEVDEDDPEDEEGRLKREVERARERATLRHKNTGKWARAMKARGELDDEQREDVAAMLDRGEKLRRRIRGETSDGERSEESSDDDGAGEDTIKAGAFEEVRRLQDGNDEEHAPEEKSVFQMKFMRDAMARDMQRVDQMADDFVKELGTNTLSEEDDEGTYGQPDGPSIQRIGGRVTFHPSTMVSTIRAFNSLASDTSSVTLRSSDLLNTTPPLERPVSPATLRITPPPISLSSPTLRPALPMNPWLVARDDAGPSKELRKKNEVVVSKESGALEKGKNKLRKQVRKREEEREKARADAELEIDATATLTLATSGLGSSTTPELAKKKAKANSDAQPIGDDSDGGSEVEDQEKVLAQKGAKASMKAFQQRDLVARAFAGDNVVRDFEEAKRREMAADAPKEVDTTLPGWGSWGGIGLQKPKPKPHLVKQVAGVDPKSRADYGKAHVIISERRDKKAAKYLVKDLPHPYTSKAQFERSVDTPLGVEWNTRIGFQRGTLPRIVKKPGAIINPLEKLA